MNQGKCHGQKGRSKDQRYNPGTQNCTNRNFKTGKTVEAEGFNLNVLVRYWPVENLRQFDHMVSITDLYSIHRFDNGQIGEVCGLRQNLTQHSPKARYGWKVSMVMALVGPEMVVTLTCLVLMLDYWTRQVKDTTWDGVLPQGTSGILDSWVSGLHR